MRHLTRTFFLLAALSLLFVAAPAYATNDGDYNTTYYDSGLQPVGWHREDCDHQETSDGDQDGAWKEVVVYSCTTYGWQTYAYRRCPGGGWRPVQYVGDTTTQINC